jgi:hypothetical protein
MASSIDLVPINSTLQVWTEGKPTSYETPVSLLAGDPAHNRRWLHDQVANQGASPPLYTLSTAAGLYLLRFFTKFNTTKESTAMLFVRVVDPAGVEVGVLEREISGKHADRIRIDFFGVTVA